MVQFMDFGVSILKDLMGFQVNFTQTTMILVCKERGNWYQLPCDKIVGESVFREIESTTQTCHDMYVLASIG